MAGGLILAGILALVTRDASTSPTSTSDTPTVASLVVGSVAGVEARDSTKGRPFTADQVPVDPDDKVIFRVKLHNKSGHDLSNVVIAPSFNPVTDLVYSTLSFSAFDGTRTDYDATASQLQFDPANAVGISNLDIHSYQLLDRNFHLIRTIAPDVHHNGSYSYNINVGPLARNATEYVTFVVNVGRNREVTEGQLAGGSLIFVRNITSPRKDYTSNYFVAKPGQTLVVSTTLFNTGFSPVVAPSIRVAITHKQGFALLVARMTPGQPYSGVPVTSLPFTINYVGDESLALRYVPGSTVSYHCPQALPRCTDSGLVKTQLPDGIVQGGIEAANRVGVGDRGDDDKNIVYVDFDLRVWRG